MINLYDDIIAQQNYRRRFLGKYHHFGGNLMIRAQNLFIRMLMYWSTGPTFNFLFKTK